MQPSYNPKDIEQKIYQYWMNNDFFKPSYKGKPYCIMLPPPNVTGILHMGHGFQNAIMDALIRYKRMCGFNVLWQPGTDHAGIATQMVVERQLLQQGKTKHDLGREKFIEKIWEWKEKSGNKILNQLQRLGDSLDWSRTRFTMDEGLSKAVLKVFVDLYDEGLIYRGKRLVNWDPVLLTAISDLEVVNEEEPGYFWYIKYPIKDSSDSLTIATTRPETMLGDTAVVVNPNDKRYKKFIGKIIVLPLVNREIPIIADEHADPEFGTGCVKITPAHDFNDYAVGQKHKLPLINILTPDAHINENAPTKYQGLDRLEARDQIIKDLEEKGLLTKTEKYTLKIPRGDRSHTIIEPFLTDQWFVKTEPLAKPAIDIVKEGKIKFIPENWNKTYFQWMENIEDWCISRQLWWGHRIPAWYDENNNIYVGLDEEHIRSKYKLSNNLNLRQDEDVLDTWFSSALWAFSPLGWPEKTKELNTFYPNDVLVTAFDIIFFWVARMIMFGLKFIGDIPFKDIYITGMIRDPEGKKMSKSKGNILDPIDLIDGIDLESLVAKRTEGLMQPDKAKQIEKATRKEFPNGILSYGTDALRFTFCSLASYTRNINFSISRLEGYRNFCNKLWNATRYVLNQKIERKNNNTKLNETDKWIISRLQKTIQKTHEYFSIYRFDLLTQELYEFTWHEFCDWYLELSKPILTLDFSYEEKQGTYETLINVLETLLRLLHPIMPFITESLWQSISHLTNKTNETIMLQPYPKSKDDLINNEIENDIEWIKNVILAIRNVRGEMNISPSKKLKVFFNKGDKNDKELIEKYHILLSNLARLDSIDWVISDKKPLNTVIAIVGQLEILVSMEEMIDKEAETARLKKELEKIKTDLKYLQDKLNNPDFLEKAPKQIVEREQKRVEELQYYLNKLKTELAF